MRLAFITTEFVTEPGFSGGLANYLGRLCPALVERGHEVHVIVRSTTNESLHVDGVCVHRTVPLWHRGQRIDRIDRLVPKCFYGPYQDLKAAWAARRKFCQLRDEAAFDIVQLSNVMAIGMFFRYEKRTPVVLRLSSFKPDCMAANGGIHSLGERVRMITERVSVRQQRNLHAPSSYVARRVTEVYQCPPPALLESPFYVESKTEDPTRLDEVTDGRPFALFFGRLSRLKGVVAIAEALPTLLERLPDLQFVVAGEDSDTAPGNNSVADYLRRQAGHHAHRLHILEPLRHDSLYPFIRAARLVVLPSLVDNLPNSALESMFFARPVIATTGTSFEQLIRHGVSGLLVRGSDPWALAESIIQVWNMAETEREKMGSLAKARIDQLHPDIIVPKLLDYYRQVMDAPSAITAATELVGTKTLAA